MQKHTFIAKIILLSSVCIFAHTITTHAQTALEKKKALIHKMLDEKMGGRREHVTPAKPAKIYDEQVSANGGTADEAEVSLAYDPNNADNLVLSFMESDSAGDTFFPLYYSSDAGHTWTLSNFNSTAILNTDFPGSLAAGYGDPSFAWDKVTGRIYYSWIYLSENIAAASDSLFFSLNWAYSDDNGHTWNVKPNHVIGQGILNSSDSVAPYKDGLTDREWLAVDNSGGPHQGNVYCTFTCFPPLSTPVFEGMKVLNPALGVFGPTVAIDTINCQFGNVEVSKTGTVHVTFADLDNNLIMHTASTDGGASFSMLNVVASAVSLTSGSYIVHNRENPAPSLSSDGLSGTGNNIHVVWSDFPGPTVISYYSHSTDGGLTWSTPYNLNSSFPGQFTFMPTVAADGNDVGVSLTVIDNMDSARYYQLNSTDNGSTFDTSVLLSASPTNYTAIGATSGVSFFGDYNRSVRSQCTDFAAWTDGRNTLGPKVYYAGTNYCALGIREITSVNSNTQLIAVFPNPATDNITLSLNAATREQASVTLYDMTGKSLLKQQANLNKGKQNITLPLAGLAKGTYIVSLDDADGIIANRAIVVQ